MLNIASNISEDGFSDSQIAFIEIYNQGFDNTGVQAIYNETVSRFAPQPAYEGNVGGRQFQQGFNG